MCCLPGSPCGIQPRQFIVALAAEEDRPAVEGFISDVCGKIGCDRLFRVQKQGVMDSVRTFFPEANMEAVEVTVEKAIKAYMGCDPISLGFLLLQLLGGLVGGRGGQRNTYANLGDCIGGAGGFLQAAQLIISWLNTCLNNLPPVPTPQPPAGGGNPLCPPGAGCAPVTPGPQPPGGHYPPSQEPRC